MTDYPFVFNWANNSKRATLKGRRCKVLVRGRMNTCLVEFENGEKVTTSFRALRTAR